MKKRNEKKGPTCWTMGFSLDLELGFDDGTYLPRNAALLLYPQYFNEIGEPIKSALPIVRRADDGKK